MDILLFIKALMLGVVEGVTEFLPISSTGYLILSADLLDFWIKDKRDLFIVVIQLGAILAVVFEYWGRLWSAFLGLITGKSATHANPRRLGIALIIATLPVMVLGIFFADKITALFHPLWVAAMLILGALVIIYAEKMPRQVVASKAEEIDYKTALYIGLCQCLALLPGTSRSGATIIGGLLFGASRTAATEFSFFLGIPVIIGAALLDLLKHKEVMAGADWGVLFWGVLVSFVVAWLSIRLLVAWVAKRDFMIFAGLRLMTGALVLIFYFGFGYTMQG